MTLHVFAVAMTPRQALWSTWSFQPVVVAGLGTSALVYSVGLRRLWRTRGGRRAVDERRAASFFAGLAVVAVALVSPVHHAGDQLLSAHMLQHLLLVMVGAPLLALGAPQLPFRLAVPSGWRTALGLYARLPGVRAAGRALSHPASAWIVGVATLWAWHLPALYDAALRDQSVHTLEHLSFLASAVLFWWVVLSPGRRRTSPGTDVLFVFTAGMANGALGALFTFGTSPIYPRYVPRAAVLGVSALADQQLAGLVMWIPAGMVSLGVASWLFVRWLRVVEREARRRDARPAPAPPTAAEDPILTGGFDR
jgi:putative membrane protein